jgi:hypothetical protein
LGLYGKENHEQYGWIDGPQVAHPELGENVENEFKVNKSCYK